MNNSSQRSSFVALCVAIGAFFALMFGQGSAAAQPILPHPIPVMAGELVPDMANCTNSHDLPTRASCAAALVNEQLTELFGITPKYTFIQSGAIGLTQLGIDRNLQPLACGYISGVLENLYCNGTVNLGEEQLSAFQWRTSDPQLTVALTTAHEAGHFLQNRLGFVNLTPIFMDARVFPYEQQSDCLAGAITERWVTQGIFPATAQYEGAAYFASIADEKDPSHGGPQDREAAFSKGYEGGVQACGAFSIGLR